MTEPVNSNSLGATVVKGAWSIPYSVASPLQKLARWTWSVLPNSRSPAYSIENQWNSCSEQTKSRIKNGAATVTGLAATAIAGTAFASYSPDLLSTGIARFGAPLVAGTATAVTTWLKNDSFKAAAIAGASVTAAGLYNPLSLVTTATPYIAASSFGALPGIVAAGAVSMATNPGQSTLLQIPKGPLLRLDNPDYADPLPDNTSLALQELSGKVCAFRTTQPPGLSWTDPNDALIQSLCEPDNKLIFERIRSSLKALGPNPSMEEKVRAVGADLREWLPDVVEANINVSLVEKIENIPVHSDAYVSAKKETDKQLDRLVKNSSLFTTLYFIHCNRLGFEQTLEVNQVFKEIIKEAQEPLSNGDLPSLWDVYIKHLGDSIGFFQKLRARFWYFLSHTIGIIPNTLNSFVKNVIGEFRKSVESSNPEKLNSVFKTGLDQLTLLLDIYNGSARKFVEENAALGPLAVYQKLAIDRLGDDLLFQRVKAQADRNPGTIDIGKTMMKELCKELTHTLINECFPRVRFFESLKKTSLLGIRIGIIFDVFDWFFGGIINFFARELTRFYLPGIVQSLVEIGLDKTLPGQYAFKIALANSITEQVVTLQEELKTPETTKPPRLVDSTFINGAADRLMTTLKIKMLGEAPDLRKVKDLFNELDTRTEVPNNEDELRKQLIEGGKVFIYFYSQKPEKMETLFSDLLRFSNVSFEVDNTIRTEADYEIALTRLKNEAKSLIKEAVKDEINKEIRGPNPQRIQEFMEGKKSRETGEIIEPGLYEVQRTKGIRSFQTLLDLCRSMKTKLEAGHADEGTKLLQELDHYAEVLKEFAAHATALEIEVYPKDVQNGFYKTFHSIYRDSVPLAQKAIEIQGPKIQYDKNLKLAHKFEEVVRLAERGVPSTTALKQRLDKIEKIGDLYNSKTPDLEGHLDRLRGHITGMEVALSDAEKERLVIEKLQELGDPSRFTYNLLSNPKDWNEKIRASILARDQPTLFKAILELQDAAQQPLRPDLSRLRAAVEDELRQILKKHVDLKAHKTGLVNTSLASFKAEAVEACRKAVEARAAGLETITVALDVLTQNTDRLLTNFKETTMPNLYLPLKDLPDHAVKTAYEVFGKPLVDSFEPYLGAAFDLITHNDIYQGTSRLLMGTINRSYPKKSAGVMSSIFQWVGRHTFPAPLGDTN